MNVQVRNKIDREEFDYQMLMSALDGYVSPRDRVTSLLRKGEIVRVKKGLYVFGEADRRRPYSRELVANLMYGPSCVSLEYALSYYGLIPERVEVVTSVTTGRARRFDTPVGLFVFHSTPSLALGVDRVAQGEGHFLMALPERALADSIHAERGAGIKTLADMERYLLEDLRIDMDGLSAMDAVLLDDLARALRSRKVQLCATLVRKFGRQK